MRVLGKGNKERIVYLNEACQDAIRRYLAVRPHDGLIDKKALFISAQRKRISPKTVQYLVKKYQMCIRDRVSSLTVESSVTCSGKVERVSVRSVYPPAPAAVQKVYVEIGDHVEDGDPLMDILVTASASETEILQETYAALLSEYTQTEIPFSDFSSIGQEEDAQQLTAPISGEVTAVSITNQGTLEFGKPAITIRCV